MEFCYERRELSEYCVEWNQLCCTEKYIIYCICIEENMLTYFRPNIFYISPK